MNKLALAAAAALSVATFGAAAIAQDSSTDFDSVDANHDNIVSFEEAAGVYTGLSEAIFAQADANGDGSLDEGEFTALRGLTAGLDADTQEPVTPSSEASSSSSAM